ncbi:MAG: ArsR family transcriptional regulator [Thaumarchaeota archaeon]|nr:ArsR family transcriptional regulator [Nitrososphaerota archaeon]
MEDQELRRVLWYVQGGARGGKNRARVIYELNKWPLNQIAEKLGVGYRTAMHHLGVPKANSLGLVQGDMYGAMHFESALAGGVGNLQ